LSSVVRDLHESEIALVLFGSVFNSPKIGNGLEFMTIVENKEPRDREVIKIHQKKSERCDMFVD